MIPILVYRFEAFKFNLKVLLSHPKPSFSKKSIQKSPKECRSPFKAWPFSSPTLAPKKTLWQGSSFADCLKASVVQNRLAGVRGASATYRCTEGGTIKLKGTKALNGKVIFGQLIILLDVRCLLLAERERESIAAVCRRAAGVIWTPSELYSLRRSERYLILLHTSEITCCSTGIIAGYIPPLPHTAKHFLFKSQVLMPQFIQNSWIKRYQADRINSTELIYITFRFSSGRMRALSCLKTFWSNEKKKYPNAPKLAQSWTLACLRPQELRSATDRKKCHFYSPLKDWFHRCLRVN